MDAARGSLSFPENDEDIILIKSGDGLPTYHFAHLADDHFMRTTHVVRSDEWLPSLPLHCQLFAMMQGLFPDDAGISWAPPVYVHTSTLDTIDSETGTQRKLSKRKDPFATMMYFPQTGFPPEAVLEYLFNIASSSYESDKASGRVGNIWDAELKIKRIPTSGALFDMRKLEWWSREFIAALPTEELAARVMAWAREFSPAWDSRLAACGEKYLRDVLGIERDNPKRIRKDFVTWSQTMAEVSYFFDDLFAPPPQAGRSSAILSKILASLDFKDDRDSWWNGMQSLAAGLGMTGGEVAAVLRMALTGRANTPDLYGIMRAMGESRVRGRLNAAITKGTADDK
jgi:glutamyl-tRNA synthetase